MLMITFLWLVLVISKILGHIVPGSNSIKTQLDKRSEIDSIDNMFNSLPYPDIDYINNHLKNLTAFNGSKCDTCKRQLKYGRQMIDTEPQNQHLISFTLFKYCLYLNKNDPTKCDTKDFFITTQTNLSEAATGDFYSGFGTETSINLYDNDFMHMLRNFNMSSDMDMSYYCYYKSSKACELPDTPNVTELFDLESKWPAKQELHNSEPDYGIAAEERELFNVLHFSDLHNQLRFTVGSEANCSQGICCLPESYNEDLPNMKNYNFTSQYFAADSSLLQIDYSFFENAHYDSDGNYHKGKYYDLVRNRGYDSAVFPASSFGGYMCDAPEVLINNSLIHMASMKREKNFELGIFTGDLVDHDELHCTPEVTWEAETRCFKLMKHYLNDTQIFPSLGNHDTFPYGQLAPETFDTNHSYQYNIDIMSDLWINQGWMPESERSDLKSHYAGFSVTTKRGLKIIGLNSNAAYVKNLWSYINLSQTPDPFGQWKFLIDELVQSEQKQQRVWIMAHIPLGNDGILPIHSDIFAKIVERFSPYTVANIFFGHTHKDEFKVLYASNKPVNMAWIVQSVTPAWNFNPSFRYYEVEDRSFNIRNTYNYYSQLNETFVNGGGEPQWQLSYSTRKAYDPNGTWPETFPLNATFWDKYVVKKLTDSSNIEFNQLYMDLQYRKTPYVPDCSNGTEITDDCYNSNYCAVSNFQAVPYIKCLRE